MSSSSDLLIASDQRARSLSRGSFSSSRNSSRNNSTNNSTNNSPRESLDVPFSAPLSQPLLLTEERERQETKDGRTLTDEQVSVTGRKTGVNRSARTEKRYIGGSAA